MKEDKLSLFSSPSSPRGPMLDNCVRRGSFCSPMAMRKKGGFSLEQETNGESTLISRSVPLVVYLFSSVIIFGKSEDEENRRFLWKKNDYKLEYEAMLPLETTFVIQDATQSNLVHVINPTRVFLLLTPSSDHAKEWVSMVNQSINAMMEAKPTLKNRREGITFSRNSVTQMFEAEERISPAFVTSHLSKTEAAKLVKDVTEWETANLAAVIVTSPEVKKHQALYMQRKLENSPTASPDQKKSGVVPRAKGTPRKRKLNMF
eukprot:CAMPEP_0201502882 /NCGR_PEP_ID=MMETSP0151_2-20130828/84370_1 /ASSEMBLY_ACC=CAM_ASM_000257 /TAXON_ID=200890 /ORGANISM="Paramoeba atlantica, Strain 621/1 / CCAP 1560/9" /LENGTH=260 /DNA_ID=CAMNT_0047896505 /DNA_START=1104 /DNA_END=1886 /DNA_ORIENTATION=+